jgi:hypothetical protein
LGIEVGLPPDRALDQAVEAMTKAGYNLGNRTQNTVTFIRHEKPDPLVAGCLALLFILPAIFYVLVRRNTLQITLAAYPAENGARLVIGGDDRQGVTGLKKWAKRLPKEPEPSQPLAPSELPENSPTTDRVSLADKLRELAELRDAGLITQEEYETKRAELLRRM